MPNASFSVLHSFTEEGDVENPPLLLHLEQFMEHSSAFINSVL